MAKKILITGYSGLSGSYIGAYLQTMENIYTVFTTSRNETSKPKHIVHDLLEPIPLSKFPSKIDCVIHCAACVDEHDTSYAVIDHNLRSSFHVIKYAIESGANCFINLSSIAVYGKPKTTIPITEKTVATPLTPYGISKLLVENLAISMLSNKMRVINLRLGYVLGPKIPDKYFLSRFKEKLKKRENIHLINPDSTKFSFVDVFDIAHACEILIKTQHEGIFNFVGDEAPTVRDVFKEMKEYFPKVDSIPTESINENNMFDITFSNEKAKKVLEITFKSYHDSFKNILQNNIWRKSSD